MRLQVVEDGVDIDTTGVLAELPLVSLVIGDDHRLDDDLDDLNDLAASIKEHGVLQALLVRQLSVDRWEVVAGRRRLAASRMAGLETVPCNVRVLSAAAASDAALAENLHRRNLSPIEEALAFAQLKKEEGLTQAQIAKRVGRSQNHVSMLLRLLELPESVRAAVHQGKLSYATALRPKIATGKQQGSDNSAPMRGDESAIVSHWRRRHDRLLNGLHVLLRVHPTTVAEYRELIERVVKSDTKPLDEQNEPKEWWKTATTVRKGPRR